MKKCILIGALAALMLFAFTACEQPGLTLPANVDYITVVQTKDFVDGDKFNAANFTVYAHDTNGGNTPVNGAKVEIDPTGEALAAGNTVEAGTTYTVKATLNVATSDNPLTATQTFTAYALESYEVNGMPSLVAFVVEQFAFNVFGFHKIAVVRAAAGVFAGAHAQGAAIDDIGFAAGKRFLIQSRSGIVPVNGFAGADAGIFKSVIRFKKIRFSIQCFHVNSS